MAGSSALNNTNGASVSWSGQGTLPFSIGDFFTGTFNNHGSGAFWGPQFAANSHNSGRVVVNSQIIPEPEEYALIFTLFALGFVFFYRQMQKKQRQAAATS